MAEDFGIPQLTEYLTRMDLKIASIDQEQEIAELAFHGNHGQWRMIVSLQQSGDVRKLMLIVPHFASVTTKRRLECLEALMTVNYRIAMGKFGLDLEDGEVRLEEVIPLANGTISFEQFNLAFNALMQTVAMYHSLLPRLIYGPVSVQEALSACEQEFLQRIEQGEEQNTIEEPVEVTSQPELDVDDVLAEVSRLFEKKKE
jgi:hypothetical protein